MKTLRRATAHRSLIRAALTIQPSHDHIGDLLDQGFVITVAGKGHGARIANKQSRAKAQRRKERRKVSRSSWRLFFAPLRENSSVDIGAGLRRSWRLASGGAL